MVTGVWDECLCLLYLLEKKTLTLPLLHISSFLESRRSQYYAALDEARQSKEGLIRWVSFFLDAVEHTSKKGTKVTQRLIEYDDELRQQKIPQLGRKAKEGLKLLDYLYKDPISNAKTIQAKLGFNPPFSQKIVGEFVKLKILDELTGNKRNRIFCFRGYLRLLQGEDLS